MMRLWFWWRYLRGKTPWDTRIVPPEIVALAERLPPGRALDLGCGTGTSTLYLAALGWQAVGVDFVPLAIRRARQRAAGAALAGQAEFYSADVSRLDFLQALFSLFMDIGCFHGLTPEQQAGYSAHVARLAAPDATFALYAFAPRLLNGRKVGVTPEGVAARFAPAFQVTQVVHGQDKGDGPASAWYFLRRVNS